MKHKTININKMKGTKMRKFILPILVAGALVASSTFAMASETNRTTALGEKHILDGSVTVNSGNIPQTVPEVGGNHYFKSDAVENGRHGGGDGFGISSTILINMLTEGTPPDDAFGFATGANPFVAFSFANSGSPSAAPLYTQPCPDPIGAEGTCPANTDPTNPQTNVASSVWDGTVLDDLYQGVGADDTTYDTGIGPVDPETNAAHIRTFDQWLDQVFHNGKRAIVSLDGGITPLLGSGDGVIDTGRHYNIDDTLDQDIADWEDINVPGENEIMGIYGKLTLNFQLAAKASSVGGGCASGGTLGSTDALCADNGQDGIAYAADWADGTNGTGGNPGLVVDPLSAAILEQLVVSDMWDWKPARDAAGASYASDKFNGLGVSQGYSSWFRDGSGLDLDYNVAINGGHGTIDEQFNTNTNHLHPDP